LGIVLSDFLPFPTGYLGLVFIGILFVPLIYLPIERKVGWIGFFTLIFFCLGLQISERDQWNFTEYSLDRDYSHGKIYSAKVLSISNSAKTWNKAILQVNGIYRFQTLQPVNETVLFYVNETVDDVEVGDELFCNAYLIPIENRNNPGEFDAERYWAAKGITKMGFLTETDKSSAVNKQGFLLRWFNSLDQGLSALFEDNLKPESVGIAKALVLGDRDHLDAEALRSFGNSGAMHVLAVSGLHVGMILSMLIFFFSKFPKWISRYRAILLSVFIIWVYAFITGLSPSVLRAVVMFSLLSFAKLSGRQYSPMNVLFGSAFILLMYDYKMIFDLGFQLSYLAMVGIFTVYPKIRDMLYFKNKLLRWSWEGTSVSLAAQLFTFPLTLYCFHQFPNYFLLSNIGLMVISNLVLVLGVLYIFLHKIPWVNLLFAWCLSFLVLGMFYFVQWVDYLPASIAQGYVLPVWQVLVIYGLILGLFFLFHSNIKRKNLISVSAILSTLFVLVFQRMKQNDTNELVIFNESLMTMTLKMDDKMYCFYTVDDYVGKSIFLAENYRKTRSSEIEYVRLDYDKVTCLKNKKLDFSCAFYESYYDIHINGKNIHLIKYTNPTNRKNKPDLFVYMPSCILDSSYKNQLRYGAFVYPIKS
jgi:competence protein ComEC